LAYIWGRALALEHNGKLYSCDHFVDKAHELGTIAQEDLVEMVDSGLQQVFGAAKPLITSAKVINSSKSYGTLSYGNARRTSQPSAGSGLYELL
jgi:hypothetical protein